MNETTQALDALVGEGKTPTGFEQIDMNFNLRMRAFIGICMPPMFRHMEKRLSMMDLRQQGIAPILFYVDFRSTNAPLAFARSLLTRHEMRLKRSITDADNRPASAGRERLLLDSETRISGRRQAGGRDSLGYHPGADELVDAGSARVLHVLTRPTAPREQRQVIEVPGALSALVEHPHGEALPDVDSVRAVPANYKAVDSGAAGEFRDVWGLPQTDINQHVNVLEYLMGMENQTSRLLDGAGLSLPDHRLTRMQMLFRKPFFPGQRYAIQAGLYRHGDHTLVSGGFHGINAQGEVDAQPFVAGAVEGVRTA